MSHLQRLWLQQGTNRDSLEVITGPKQPFAMEADWQPSNEALDILVRAGIERGFVIAAVPEFILYWRERGDVSNTWDSRFVAHIRRQWARYWLIDPLDGTKEFVNRNGEVTVNICTGNTAGVRHILARNQPGLQLLEQPVFTTRENKLGTAAQRPGSQPV